jgi:hypothetical protein
MGGKLARPPELDATFLRAFAAFSCPRADQLPLKFGKTAEYRQHQSTVRGGGVGPGVPQRSEAGAALGYGIDHVEQVPIQLPTQPGRIVVGSVSHAVFGEADETARIHPPRGVRRDRAEGNSLDGSHLRVRM